MIVREKIDVKKFLLVALVTVSFGTLCAEGTLFSPERATSEDASAAFYSYAQMVYIYPGGGLSYAIQRKNLGIQFDANGAFVQGRPLGGVSCSAAYYPFAKGGKKKNHHGGWNVTTGLGAFALLNPEALYLGPYAPVFLGYQGKKIFFNAGVSIAPVFPKETEEKKEVKIVPVPTLKLGFQF